MSTESDWPREVARPKRLCAAACVAMTLLFAPIVASVVAAEDETSEPGDVKFVRQAAGMDDVAPATFPHWIHRLSYTCYACHDAPYKMQLGATPVTMDEIQSGQSCGLCHNGKIAFESNLTTCSRCHR